MTRKLSVGVVGTGSQGRHHVRILSRLPEARLVGVYDADPEVAARVAAEHGTRAAASLDELAGSVEAAVVAVPTRDHLAVGLPLLERGVHLLVEKPIAASRAEAQRLVSAAGDRVVAVGHIEFFNPAVQALLDRRLAPGFAEIHRLAEFKPRSLDINVILDLMIHDLQVLHALDPSPVREIRANGIHVLTDQIDIANVRIELESGCVANLTASRVSRETIRKLRLFSRNGAYYSLDYLRRRLHEVRLERTDAGPRIEQGEVEIGSTDSMELELTRFLAACRGEPARLVDAEQGLFALTTALSIVDALSSSGRAGSAAEEGSRA